MKSVDVFCCNGKRSREEEREGEERTRSVKKKRDK
jgi:hypothetical protein